MDKRISTLAAATAQIANGATVMIGGFGGSGAPIELIHALIDRFVTTGSPGNLTVINNNAGNGHVGIAAMIEQGMVARMICSFPRSADPVVFTERYLAGQIDLELVPQERWPNASAQAGRASRPSTPPPGSAPTWRRASPWPNSTAGPMCRSAG